MDKLLNIQNLKVYFYVRKGIFQTVTVRAVDGVSLTLDEGETVAVVGESGSGKTTLGRATLRLVQPVGGSIFFDGQDINIFSEDELKNFRQRAQPIFQDPYSSINPYMTVYQLVEEPLLIHGVASRSSRKQLVMQALEKVKLVPSAEFAPKYPHTLSGGQRQRVSIARSLVLSPQYIVADEPVSMIDASSRAEILYLLRELQKTQELSFLYITHDIATARYFSDKIAVMYSGCIVELGPSSQLIDSPLHPYTHGLLEAVPEPDPQNRLRLRPVIPGEPPSAINVPAGCPFHPRCQRVQDTCRLNRPSLEEVSPGQRTACHLYPAN